MNLYELATEFREAEAAIEEAENFDEADFLTRLQAVKMEEAQKAAGVIAWVRSVQAEQEARKTEIDRLRAMNAATGRKEDALRKYLFGYLKATSQQKIKTPIGTASIKQPGAPRTEVDESRIPEWNAEVYDHAIKVGALQEVYKVNKTLLKEHFADILDKLPGVEQIEGEETLSIR